MAYRPKAHAITEPVQFQDTLVTCSPLSWASLYPSLNKHDICTGNITGVSLHHHTEHHTHTHTRDWASLRVWSSPSHADQSSSLHTHQKRGSLSSSPAPGWPGPPHGAGNPSARAARPADPSGAWADQWGSLEDRSACCCLTHSWLASQPRPCEPGWSDTSSESGAVNRIMSYTFTLSFNTTDRTSCNTAHISALRSNRKSLTNLNRQKTVGLNLIKKLKINYIPVLSHHQYFYRS